MRTAQNIKLIIVSLLILCVNLLFSQDKSQDAIYYKSDFEISERIIINEDSLIAQRYQSYNVETPYWKSDKSIKILKRFQNQDKLFFLIETGDEGQSGATLTRFDDDIFGFHPMRSPIKSFTVLEKSKFSELPITIYLSAKAKANLSNLKSMAELTEDDLINSIKFVQSYESLCTELITDTNYKRFDAFRISENLYNIKLYQLGYNPYQLPEKGNYLDKFNGNDKIKSLFNTENIFQLRID